MVAIYDIFCKVCYWLCQIQLHFGLEIELLEEENCIFVKIMHEFQIQIIHSFMLQLQEKILEIIIVKLKFLNFVFLRFYIVYFFALNI